MITGLKGEYNPVYHLPVVSFACDELDAGLSEKLFIFPTF